MNNIVTQSFMTGVHLHGQSCTHIVQAIFRLPK